MSGELVKDKSCDRATAGKAGVKVPLLRRHTANDDRREACPSKVCAKNVTLTSFRWVPKAGIEVV